MIKWHRYLILLLGILLLSACSKDKSNLIKYVNKVKSRPPGRIEPVPVFKPQKHYVYKGYEKRNPFQVKLKRSKVGKPDASRPKEPLEAFPLDSLKMVGTLSRGSRLWALIEAPRGIVYYVTVGSYLGKDHGQVTKITKDKVYFTETVLDRLGSWEKRNATLSLHRASG